MHEFAQAGFVLLLYIFYCISIHCPKARPKGPERVPLFQVSYVEAVINNPKVLSATKTAECGCGYTIAPIHHVHMLFCATFVLCSQ